MASSISFTELAVDSMPYSLNTSNVRHRALALKAMMMSTPVRWATPVISSMLRRSFSSYTMAPEERLDEKALLQIRKSQEAGVITRVLTQHDDPKPFYQLLRAYYRLKPRKFVPSLTFFEELLKSPEARLCLTEHNGKAIGCCVLVFSGGNAYLWFMAAKRMSQASLHPDTMTVWNAIQLARQEGCRHIYFMDAGLPFRKSNYRDFILKFGGKPVAKYRWFRFSIKSLNKFLAWLYRE